MLEESTTAACVSRPDLRLVDLVKAVPTLHTTDSLAKALSQFGQAGLGVLPVVEGESLLGVLTESDVMDWYAERESEGPVAPEASHDAMVLSLMRTRATVGYAEDLLEDAIAVFSEGRYRALPIIDNRQRYRGMLTRQAFLAALTHNLRPATIGGMATPLGVYLTTGSVSAGVGFWGLFLTGAIFTVTNWLISVGVYQAQLLSGVKLPESVEALVSLGLFLIFLRLSPLSGFHAAEHQTVNAIERGEVLQDEVVAGMPREHPRCGTNLMALLFGAQLLLPFIAQEPLWLLPAIALLYVSWRRVGGWLQRFFTTKKAAPYQLASGIRAGEALLRAYSARPAYKANRARRLWNMGLLQILIGSLSAFGVLELAYHFIPSLRGIIL